MINAIAGIETPKLKDFYFTIVFETSDAMELTKDQLKPIMDEVKHVLSVGQLPVKKEEYVYNQGWKTAVNLYITDENTTRSEFSALELLDNTKNNIVNIITNAVKDSLEHSDINFLLDGDTPFIVTGKYVFTITPSFSRNNTSYTEEERKSDDRLLQKNINEYNADVADKNPGREDAIQKENLGLNKDQDPATEKYNLVISADSYGDAISILDDLFKEINKNTQRRIDTSNFTALKRNAENMVDRGNYNEEQAKEEFLSVYKRISQLSDAFKYDSVMLTMNDLVLRLEAITTQLLNIAHYNLNRTKAFSDCATAVINRIWPGKLRAVDRNASTDYTNKKNTIVSILNDEENGKILVDYLSTLGLKGPYSYVIKPNNAGKETEITNEEIILHQNNEKKFVLEQDKLDKETLMAALHFRSTDESAKTDINTRNFSLDYIRTEPVGAGGKSPAKRGGGNVLHTYTREAIKKKLILPRLEEYKDIYNKEQTLAELLRAARTAYKTAKSAVKIDNCDAKNVIKGRESINSYIMDFKQKNKPKYEKEQREDYIEYQLFDPTQYLTSLSEKCEEIKNLFALTDPKIKEFPLDAYKKVINTSLDTGIGAIKEIIDIGFLGAQAQLSEEILSILSETKGDVDSKDTVAILDAYETEAQQFIAKDYPELSKVMSSTDKNTLTKDKNYIIPLLKNTFNDIKTYVEQHPLSANNVIRMYVLNYINRWANDIYGEVINNDFFLNIKKPRVSNINPGSIEEADQILLELDRQTDRLEKSNQYSGDRILRENEESDIPLQEHSGLSSYIQAIERNLNPRTKRERELIEAYVRENGNNIVHFDTQLADQLNFEGKFSNKTLEELGVQTIQFKPTDGQLKDDIFSGDTCDAEGNPIELNKNINEWRIRTHIPMSSTNEYYAFRKELPAAYKGLVMYSPENKEVFIKRGYGFTRVGKNKYSIKSFIQTASNKDLPFVAKEEKSNKTIGYFLKPEYKCPKCDGQMYLPLLSYQDQQMSGSKYSDRLVCANDSRHIVKLTDADKNAIVNTHIDTTLPKKSTIETKTTSVSLDDNRFVYTGDGKNTYIAEADPEWLEHKKTKLWNRIPQEELSRYGEEQGKFGAQPARGYNVYEFDETLEPYNDDILKSDYKEDDEKSKKLLLRIEELKGIASELKSLEEKGETLKESTKIDTEAETDKIRTASDSIMGGVEKLNNEVENIVKKTSDVGKREEEVQNKYNQFKKSQEQNLNLNLKDIKEYLENNTLHNVLSTKYVAKLKQEKGELEKDIEKITAELKTAREAIRPELNRLLKVSKSALDQYNIVLDLYNYTEELIRPYRSLWSAYNYYESIKEVADVSLKFFINRIKNEISYSKERDLHTDIFLYPPREILYTTLMEKPLSELPFIEENYKAIKDNLKKMEDIYNDCISNEDVNVRDVTKKTRRLFLSSKADFMYAYNNLYHAYAVLKKYFDAKKLKDRFASHKEELKDLLDKVEKINTDIYDLTRAISRKRLYLLEISNNKSSETTENNAENNAENNTENNTEAEAPKTTTDVSSGFKFTFKKVAKYFKGFRFYKDISEE